ncbi:MAG: hypothetical protein AAB019_06925 [Planctomycetota bacterium]
MKLQTGRVPRGIIVGLMVLNLLGLLVIDLRANDLVSRPRLSGVGGTDVRNRPPEFSIQLNSQFAPGEDNRNSKSKNGWYLSLTPVYRQLSGEAEVREFDVTPTDLTLQGDLKIKPSLGYRWLIKRVGPQWEYGLGTEIFYWSGKNTFPDTVAYDGDRFPPGIPIKTEGFSLLIRIPVKYTPSFFDFQRSRIKFVGGLEHLYSDIALDNGLDRGSEQFRQFLPYPFLGLEGEYHLTDSLTWTTSISGAYVLQWDTGAVEGGPLMMRTKSFTFQTYLELHKDSAFSFHAGYEFFQWWATLNSDEDGNKLEIKSPAFSLGVSYKF